MRAAVLVVVVLLLSGCSGGHADAVRQAADDWSRAIDSGDWAAACELMAPVTVKELEKSEVHSKIVEAKPPARVSVVIASTRRAPNQCVSAAKAGG